MITHGQSHSGLARLFSPQINMRLRNWGETVNKCHNRYIHNISSHLEIRPHLLNNNLITILLWLVSEVFNVKAKYLVKIKTLLTQHICTLFICFQLLTTCYLVTHLYKHSKEQV